MMAKKTTPPLQPKLFALRHKGTGELLSVITYSNDGQEYCTEVTHEFTMSGNAIWVTNDHIVAEKAATNSEEWYNAGFNTPMNPYAGRLEVVTLGILT